METILECRFTVILNQLLFIASFLIIFHICRAVVNEKVRDVGKINMKLT